MRRCSPLRAVNIMATPLTKLYPQESPALQPAQAPFINRDVSLIEFYRRVLGEALDENQPLLERIKFVAIFSSLIDEFYMIRIATLRERAEGSAQISPDGLTPVQQLDEIRKRIREMKQTQEMCFQNDLMPALSENGIEIAKFEDLTDAERGAFETIFEKQIFPVLTPQAIDPTHPFPYISGSTLNLGLYISPKLDKRVRNALHLRAEQIFVRMKIPSFLPRLMPIEGRPDMFVLIEDVIKNNMSRLIPGVSPDDCSIFRITRDADIELKESEAADLLEMMEENLRQRRFGEVTRLEISTDMPVEMSEYLRESLELPWEDVYRSDVPLNLADLGKLVKVNRPELKDTPIRAFVPEELSDADSLFEVIGREDVMLHHPYMPYHIVTDFIKEAAEDPDVLAIKICLYRLGTDSPIPPLLIKASENGKQVTALIELKARFDESNNIEWARKLEEAGVHVIYGLLGLKTHAKTTLIVRKEGDQLRRYVHVATGNYNPETSAAYTDLGLLTADEKIGADVTDLFNFLTVYTRPERFNDLLVAPITLRDRMQELIEREIEHAKNGRPARIVAKLNRLADGDMVNLLYDASRAGVDIDLIIRGICTLRPGIEGVSENIRVRSVVGGLLEHSRVYCFANGGDSEILIGSSDWMPRNLDRRVEVLTPVKDPMLRKYLIDNYLEKYLQDNTNAHELMSSGDYAKLAAKSGSEPITAQREFIGDMGLFEKFKTK